MIRIQLDSVNIPLQGVNVGRLLQSRNRWRAAAYLFAAAFLAVCAMGCGSDGGGAGDGGASADGGATRDSGGAPRDGSTTDGATSAGDGGNVQDGGASADAALPVSWTGLYAINYNELSRTCPTHVSLSFMRLRYVEGQPTASWEQPGVLSVPAEVARDFTWLTVGGRTGALPGTRVTPVTFTQGPPKTISGTLMWIDTVKNCTETYSVIGVRP